MARELSVHPTWTGTSPSPLLSYASKTISPWHSLALILFRIRIKLLNSQQMNLWPKYLRKSILENNHDWLQPTLDKVRHLAGRPHSKGRQPAIPESHKKKICMAILHVIPEAHPPQIMMAGFGGTSWGSTNYNKMNSRKRRNSGRLPCVGHQELTSAGVTAEPQVRTFTGWSLGQTGWSVIFNPIKIGFFFFKS